MFVVEIEDALSNEGDVIVACDCVIERPSFGPRNKDWLIEREKPVWLCDCVKNLWTK